jgi:opacity protein-like surface antigen
MLKYGAILAVLCFSASFAAAQEYPVDVSVGAGPAISKSTSGNQTTQTVTKSFIGLGTIRLNLSKRNSVEFSYGRIRNTQEYFAAPTYLYRVQDTLTEYTGAYVFRPMKWHNFHPFLLAGGGVLRFYPDYNGTTINNILTPFPAQTQTRPTFLYGGGFDYRITKRWGFRMQYRGFLYQVPDFRVSNLFTGATGNLSAPSVGVVFRF